MRTAYPRRRRLAGLVSPDRGCPANARRRESVELSVKLIGHLLDDVAHAGAGFDGRRYVIADRATPRDLAADIGLSADAEYFVMVNGDHVTESALDTHELKAGDQVVLCPPLKGG